jgi:hypothetical protein
MATKKQPKQANLSLATVKKVSKRMDETHVHIIEEGEYIGQQITFTILFNDKTIEQILTETAQLLKEAEEKEIELSQNMQIYLIYMLTIKYFTHFKDDIPTTLLGEDKNAGLLDTLDHFHRTGLLDECFNRMFLPAEVNKVFSKSTDMAAMGLLTVDLEKKMFKKFESLKIKNEDVFKQLEKINTEPKVVQ